MVDTATAAPAAKTGNGKAPVVALRPFITSTFEIESHVYDNTTAALGAAPVALNPYDVVTDGYLAGLYIWVVGTTAANAAATTFVANGPWSVIQTVQFSDVSNRPIIGPMSGWELKECIKYGGYSFSDDPHNSTTYVATTGAGATGGSFEFILHLPIEFVHKNALGALTNLSNAAVFRLEMTLAPLTQVYGVSPTTPPSVRVRVLQHGWMESNGKDARGRAAAATPLGVDTVQYWDKQTYAVNAGAQDSRFTAFEGQVRTLILVYTDGAGSRTVGETNWPDPFRLRYDSVVPYDRFKIIWRRMMEEQYGYVGALDAANGKENGVYVISWARDFGLKVGAEQGFGYLPVSSGTALRYSGSFGGAGTLTALWNYINPAGGNDLAITGGR